VPGEGSLRPSDSALLDRTYRGDRDAFSDFVERHQEAVFRYLCARIGSHADCEDILQETFLAAFRGAGSFRGDASARAWVLGIARNCSRRHFRKRVGEPDNLLSMEDLGLQAGWGGPPFPESFLETLARRDVLEKALSRLSPEEREVLVLRELEGLSGEETARVMDLSLGAMKSRLHRARLSLASVLVGGDHG
jgi:RNA polymerase sigma-70 factor (ECF subfamily)